MLEQVSRRSVLKFAAAGGVCAMTSRLLAAPQKVDILITHAYVHTLNAERAFYRNGAVAISGQQIVGVGPTDTMVERFAADTTVDASGRMLLPGFFDNHLHPALFVPSPPLGKPDAFAIYPGGEGAVESRPPSPFMPGGDSQAFMQRLLPLARHGYSDEETYYFALHAFMTCAAAGTTCFVDGGAGATRALVEAQLDIGLRGNVSRVAYDMLTDASDPAESLQRAENTQRLLAEAEQLYKDLHGRGRGLVHYWFSFFLERACSDELIKGMADLARAHGTGLSSHSVGDFGHDEYSQRHFGRRTLDRLEALGVLGPNWLAAHMGLIGEADIPRLKASGCKIAHCPGTSLFGGIGYISHTRIFPKLVDAGVPVSLGSDTANRGVVLREAQRAFEGHKEAWRDSRVFPAYTVLRMLTSTGSECALRPDCGVIEAGRKADLILVDIDNPRYLGADPLAALLYVGYPSDISSTMVDGKFIYKDRRFTTIDSEAVLVKVAELSHAKLQDR